MNASCDKLKLRSLQSFWYVSQKNPPTHSRDRRGWKYPPPSKTAVWKTRENGPKFLKIKNGFLFVKITISDHHIDSTIVFFILCAKNLKKQHITTNYNLIIFHVFCNHLEIQQFSTKKNIIMISTFIFYSFWPPESNATIHFTLKCFLDPLRSP